MNIEQLVRDCITAVLRNEGYSKDNTQCAINWNYQEIKEIIDIYLKEVDN
jgi:hypothetical protein